MVNFYCKCMSIILAIFCLSSLVVAQEKGLKKEIILGTFIYPPLMYEKTDMQGRQGIGLDIIKKAFLSSDKFTLKIEILPIKRSMEEIKKGRIDLFLGSRLDLPLLKNDITAIQLTSLKSVLFCLPKQCDIANKQELAKDLGTVASIPGSPVNAYLENLGNKIVPLQSLQKSFDFLLMKRANYVAAINFSGLYTLQKMEIAEANNIEQAKFTLLDIPYDVVIKKNHAHAEEISHLIRKSLQSLGPKIDSENLVEDYLNGKTLFK